MRGEFITAQFGPGEPCSKCGRPINEHTFQEYVTCHDRKCERCQRMWTKHRPGELAVCSDAIYEAHEREYIDQQLVKRRRKVEALLAVVCFGFLLIMALLNPEPLFTAWRVLTH